MTTTVKTLLAAAVALPMLAACPAPAPTTPGKMPQPITGNVIKGTAPFENATVRLIEKANNVSQNREVKTTDKMGNFSFENVPPGSYRVAFDRATKDQLNNKETVYYTAGTDTFGFFSTNEFTLEGNATAPKVIPQMNVLWSANLDPAPDASVSAPVTFKWNAASGAQSYKVRGANAANNTVFTSESLPATQTSFTWDGMAGGKKVDAGSYLWSVNVDLADGSAGTNVSKFTLK